jgi:uncharacterized protein (DUF2249 family)
MADTTEIDVRGLEPPEPLERILALLDSLGEGDSLRVKIDCRPIPLYRLLQRNGYPYKEHPGSDSLYEITIYSREGA